MLKTKILIGIGLIVLVSTSLIGCVQYSDWLKGKDSQETNEKINATAKIAALLTITFVPEGREKLKAVCAAVNMSDRDLMVKALRELWTAADKAQAVAVVTALNDLVGATKILDESYSQTQLSDWRDNLGSMCTVVY